VVGVLEETEREATGTTTIGLAANDTEEESGRVLDFRAEVGDEEELLAIVSEDEEVSRLVTELEARLRMEGALNDG